MIQEDKFFMTEQERVDGLTNLLIKILKKEGVNLRPKGGARTTVDKRFDFSLYVLFAGSKQIGCYEFELKKGKYECLIDLHGLSVDDYQRIKEIVGKEFPEINQNKI